jgi:hypothetical protein
MLDGFGWFPEHVYRRNWLLFDDVDYVFPVFAKGISVPPKLYLSSEFHIVQPSLNDEVIDRIAAFALDDANDPQFCAFIESAVPKRDYQCAGGIVDADSQVDERRLRSVARKPAFAISYLAQKLVAYANSTGTVPIVGQDYAVKVVARVVRRGATGPIAADGLVFGRRASVVHAVGAGLSLRFVSDDLLARADVETLAVFKRESTALRDAHHAHLLKVAQEYDGFPVDDTFPELLAGLRAEAEGLRTQLDAQARDVWLSAGLELGGRALAGAAAAAVAAVALIRADLLGALAAAIPGALTGAAVAASRVADTVHTVACTRRSYMSYLTDAQRYLERND